MGSGWQALVAISRAILSTVGSDENLNLIVQTSATLTGADRGLLLLGGVGGQLEVVASQGVEAEQLDSLPAPFDPSSDSVVRDLFAKGSKTVWTAPVVSRGHRVGWLALAWSQPHSCDPEEDQLLCALADQVALALEQAARQRMMQTGLAWQRRLLRVIQSDTDRDLALLDRELRFVEANSSCCLSIGLSRDQLVGRTHLEVFGSPELIATLERVRDTGQAHEFREMPTRPLPHHPDQRARFQDWSARPVVGADGAVEGLVVSAVDVTEKVRARQALEEERRLLRTVVDQLPAAVILAEAPSGRVVLANASSRRLLGRLNPSVAGGLAGCLRPDGSPYTAEDLPPLRALRSGEIVRDEELMLPRAEGGYSILTASASPVRDEQGRVGAVVASFHDITERKQMEQALEHQARALAEANETKTIFFNTLSHELRTPLSAVLNALRLLRHPDATDTQRFSAEEVIERNVHHQARLIDDLLDLSGLMRDQLRVELLPLDLREVVEAQLRAIEPLAAEAGLTLTRLLPPEPFPVRGDRVRLEQVMHNLLSNAVRFTQRGGQITVALEVQSGRALVRVRDTGVGIAPERLPCLFEPFPRADSSLTRTVGGLGVGLALARLLVDRHGGTISGASEGPGRGSEFLLALPLDPSRPSGSSGSSDKPGSGPRRVLVVEDNPDLRETLAMLLELLGHEVLVAADGSSAIASAREAHPQVALIDIGLPDIDGYELARRLHDDPSLRELRLVALTGYAGQEHRTRAAEAGFHHFLAKPVDMAHLEEVLQG